MPNLPKSIARGGSETPDDAIAVRSLLSPQRPKMYFGCFFLCSPLRYLGMFHSLIIPFKESIESNFQTVQNIYVPLSCELFTIKENSLKGSRNK